MRWARILKTRTRLNKKSQKQQICVVCLKLNFEAGSDTWLLGDREKVFNVKACVLISWKNRLRSTDLLRDGFPCKLVWCRRVPTKVYFLSWLILRELASAQDKITGRELKLAGRCVMCVCSKEEADRLFLNCNFVSRLEDSSFICRKSMSTIKEKSQSCACLVYPLMGRLNA